MGSDKSSIKIGKNWQIVIKIGDIGKTWQTLVKVV